MEYRNYFDSKEISAIPQDGNFRVITIDAKTKWRTLEGDFDTYPEALECSGLVPVGIQKEIYDPSGNIIKTIKALIYPNIIDLDPEDDDDLDANLEFETEM